MALYHRFFDNASISVNTQKNITKIWAFVVYTEAN